MNKSRGNFKWFNLDNYKCLQNFTLSDWRAAIGTRLYMSRIEDRAYWENIRVHGATQFLLQRSLMEKLHEETAQQFKGQFHLFQHPSKRQRKHTLGAISDLTVLDVIFNVLGRENFKEIQADFNNHVEGRRHWLDVLQTGEASALIERKKFHEKYQTRISDERKGFPGEDEAKNRTGYIKIDLSASDEQIKDNFLAWLGAQRSLESTKRSTRITQSDVEDWTTAKVLPYFDLITIARLDGMRISNHLTGDLLFPDEFDVDVAERIRKVTKVKAQKVFCWDTIEILAAQISEAQKTERQK